MNSNANHSELPVERRWKSIVAGAVVATAAFGLPTAAPAAEPPGGAPMVIIAADGFGRYLGDILEAEGMNEYNVVGLEGLNALSSYDTALLGPTALSDGQVNTLTAWVNGGGNLVAMKPDKKLAGLLGLSSTSGTLAEGYVKVDTSASPGAGIVADTMQFHGTADRYGLQAGTRQVAALFNTAIASAGNPAVSLRDVGSSGGQAAAFTYDLAKSVIYTRQGNPAWAGLDRDGAAPIRSNDLFWAPAPADPNAAWVNPAKIAIPQADEQQRLLANLVTSMTLDRAPLPRFWYLPRGLDAAVVMTGDDHANNGTVGRFNANQAASDPGCSVANWECVRSTSYVYPGTTITNAEAVAFTNAGFELALHTNTGCENYTVDSLSASIDAQEAALASQLPSWTPSVTNRTHCIPWSDWASQPEVQATKGIHLDTTYYYWPGAWAATQPGVFTGSGFPMRYADLDGTSINVYQAATQMTDESAQAYPETVDALLDKAAGSQGFYGAFTANIHTDDNDQETSQQSNAIIASADAHGVPVISAKQLLTWTDGRNSSSFGNVDWSGNALTFNLTAGSGSNGLQALLPLKSSTGSTLSNLTRGGAAVSFTTRTIKGVEYAAFAGTNGAWKATYAAPTPPPTTPPSVQPPVVGGVSERSGYWMVGDDGMVYPFGDAKAYGNPSANLAGIPAMDLEPTPTLNGYWIVDRTGRIFAYGDAVHHGNANVTLTAGETITSLSTTKTGNGYWLFTNKGRVIPLGDATPYGDLTNTPLNGPILDSVATPTGNGYYMVASDGGIFTFGDAKFAGSLGSTKLNAPVQSMVPDADNKGYWLVASDGGIFAFDAPFLGSLGSTKLNKPVVGMVRYGNGYLMVAADGGIFNYATNKPFAGSLGNNPPTHPITATATLS